MCNCATVQLYEGSDQPPENIVVINGTCVWAKSLSDYWSKVTVFDGKTIKNCQVYYEFLPGKHTLSFLSGTGYHTTVTKEFIAGERYKLTLTDNDLHDGYPALIYIGKYNKETGEVEPYKSFKFTHKKRGLGLGKKRRAP